MSATVKAHGMDGTLVKPDWLPLALDEVRTLLARFPDAGEAEEIVFASPRPFSAAGVVRTARGKVFVKRHHQAVRDRDGLLEEHRFLEHLRARGVSVPRVLKDEAGESAIQRGAWTYEVHEAAKGVDAYRDALSWTPFHSAEHAHQAGRALARLHLASEEYDAPRRRVRPLLAGFTVFANENPAAEMERYLEARPALARHAGVLSCAAKALDLLAPFHAELVPLLTHLPPLWTHNDLHASNLLWSDAGECARAASIIDFGLADRTNAVHDLAHAIERNMVEWLELVAHPERPEQVPIHFDHLDALLDGYESLRPLSAEEAAALAPMAALCHAEFALSEADYFLGVLHSEEKAEMAYNGWLVGHARWFCKDAGGRLLDAIRQWPQGRTDRPTDRQEKVTRQ